MESYIRELMQAGLVDITDAGEDGAVPVFSDEARERIFTYICNLPKHDAVAAIECAFGCIVGEMAPMLVSAMVGNRSADTVLSDLYIRLRQVMVEETFAGDGTESQLELIIPNWEMRLLMKEHPDYQSKLGEYLAEFPDWDDPGEKPEQIPAARLPERKYG